MPIAPATNYETKAQQADPEKLSPRRKRDAMLGAEIMRVWGKTKRTTISSDRDPRPLDLVQRSFRTDLRSDTLEQALRSRKAKGGLIRHSDTGSQYLALRYSEFPIEAGVKASVGSVGDTLLPRQAMGFSRLR
jgi:hypothetical protein